MSQHEDGHDLEALLAACKLMPLAERQVEISRLRRIEMEREKIPLLAELRARLENPTPEQVAAVCDLGRLPRRTFPGLAALEQNSTNAPAIAIARTHGEGWRKRQHPRDGRGLYFHSTESGTGKTTILCALAWELLHWGGEHTHPRWQGGALIREFPRPTVQFWKVADLLETLQQSFKGNNEFDPESVKTCDLLILDDLGKVRPSDWNLLQLFSWLDVRDAEMRPTWYSSNYSLLEISKRYIHVLGSQYRADVLALTDRIAGNCEQVEFTGASWRLG